jgi:carbon-monoxide dehydrogenase medium subunit
MIPAAFEYSRARSVDEALSMLAAANGSAKVLAGGHSLLPLMKLRLARPERLIDIGRLDELRGVRSIAGGRVAIGALTTYDELMSNEVIGHYGLMNDALPNIGDVQVRNRGTIGGSIAHVDPASDMPAILLALNAELLTRSPRGGRTIAIGDFMTGPFTSLLEPDELLIEIQIPGGMPGFGSAYRTIEQPASGYSIAGAAAVVGREPGRSGPWDVIAVALTGVGEIPYRASAVEAALHGGASPAEASKHATDGQTVASDIHADRVYRAHVATVQVRRALEAAFERAG